MNGNYEMAEIVVTMPEREDINTGDTLNLAEVLVQHDSLEGTTDIFINHGRETESADEESISEIIKYKSCKSVDVPAIKQIERDETLEKEEPQLQLSWGGARQNMRAKEKHLLWKDVRGNVAGKGEPSHLSWETGSESTADSLLMEENTTQSFPYGESFVCTFYAVFGTIGIVFKEQNKRFYISKTLKNSQCNSHIRVCKGLLVTDIVSWNPKTNKKQRITAENVRLLEQKIMCAFAFGNAITMKFMSPRRKNVREHVFHKNSKPSIAQVCHDKTMKAQNRISNVWNNKVTKKTVKARKKIHKKFQEIFH